MRENVYPAPLPQPRLARRDDQRAFGRITMDRATGHGLPARIALLARSAARRRGLSSCSKDDVIRRLKLQVSFGEIAGAVKLVHPLAVTIRRTVISFFVSVPVLSEAITFAEPRASTAASYE